MKKLYLMVVCAVMSACMLTGCGEEPKNNQLQPEGVEEIIVEEIKVEEIQIEEIKVEETTWENADIQTW